MFGISIKRMTGELEAKLRAPDGGDSRGKAERKWYADGSEKLSVWARGLDLADGAALTVRFDDRDIAVLEIIKGSAQLRLESGNGIEIPTANDGETVRILHNGTAVLTGTFRPD